MTVWMAWHQGLPQAPDIVRRVHALWQRFEGGDRVRLLEGDEVDAILASEGVEPAKLTMQVRANLVRLILLARRGGVWADATLLPVAPLSNWLTGHLDREGFFAFRNPGAGRLLANWFLAAEAGNPLICAWNDAYLDYFRAPRTLVRKAPVWVKLEYSLRCRLDPESFATPRIAARSAYYPYYVCHYHFGHLVRSDSGLHDAWERVPAVPARIAFQLSKYCRTGADGASETELVAHLRHAPVHKLNWRKPEDYDRAIRLIEDGVIGPEANFSDLADRQSEARR